MMRAETRIPKKGDGMKKREKRSFPAPAGRSVEGRMERGAAGSSRPPLARMLRLHEQLMANRYPNCRQMGEEFEVSAKTVQRDVNFMRDRVGLPIEYDRRRFGFHYTRPVRGLPPMGTPTGNGSESPWRHSAPPTMGERPALAAAGRGGLAVRIGFDAESARMVRRRTWHATQVIKALPDGGVEMTLRARDECEIARWVLSWGGHAWVIQPSQVGNRVREMAGEILARHQ
jgi:hypothetical protein